MGPPVAGEGAALHPHPHPHAHAPGGWGAEAGLRRPEAWPPRQAAGFPRHVAVIMDGNSRWAAAHGQVSRRGHAQGVAALRATVRCAGAWGVAALTVFAFSTENWLREGEEVDFLLDLLDRTLREELPELRRNGVRVRVIGDRGRLPPPLRYTVARAEEATAGGEGMTLNVALSYSGRSDIVQAARAIARRVEAGEVAAADVDEQMLARHLSTGGLPEGLRDPDLLIRTSGEQRLSNFLLWQLAYTEIYFSPVKWPDWDALEFRKAIESYLARDRRYGRRRGEAGVEEVGRG